MKQLFKALLPAPLFEKARQMKLFLKDKRNKSRSARDVFSEIYENGDWGGSRGCSGSGSVVDAVTEPYIKTVGEYLQTAASHKTIVDLGCGDMRVGKQLLIYCEKYIGVDVVPFLIEKHKSTNWERDGVSFQCLDLTKDELPDGDICILRQVLQHLSNDEISRVLNKIRRKYKSCILTEHYPSDNPAILPNKDMIHGSKIRLYQNSGVCLDKPPFYNSLDKIHLMLEVPGAGMVQGLDQGVIRTFRVEFTNFDEIPNKGKTMKPINTSKSNG